jgi:ATP-dependent Clp protease ATP-binding subunit ClpA
VAETEVVVYIGPFAWYRSETGFPKPESFYDVLLAAEAARGDTHHYHHGLGHKEEDSPTEPRITHVEMLSHDYGSLSVSAIQNFATHVKTMNPRQLSLHNPPEQVLTDVVEHLNAVVCRHDYKGPSDETLLAFNKSYNTRITGQTSAKRTLLSLLHKQAQNGASKPLVVMLYGPSGVGKTETAHFISELLGQGLFRQQFSMFQNQDFATFLFGGSHSEPSFARKLLDRESNVILIDEFDKAPSGFFSAFYELFDEGVFEDKNYRVTVGPAVVLCTSNYASEREIRVAMGDALASRFDAMVKFRALSRDDMVMLAEKECKRCYENLGEADQQYVDLEEIKLRVAALIQTDGNVRRLNKIVTQVISRYIVDRKYPEPEEHRV